MRENGLLGAAIRSPKLAQAPKDRWYRYYAGYAPEFVSDVFTNVLPSDRSLAVLDPWMGSGTTLSVGARKNHSVTGADLNPAMIVVARGRLVAQDSVASIAALSAQVRRSWTGGQLVQDEPLTQWFDHETASYLRQGANVTQRLLEDPSPDLATRLANASSLACFFQVALFEVAVQHLRSFGSRNPTWRKSRSIGEGEISVPLATLKSTFETAVTRLTAYLKAAGDLSVASRDRALVLQGDSRELKLEKASFDVVLTSPPYLTRLDYVVGHLPELAMLGVRPVEIKPLRDLMIGTPTMGTVASEAEIGIAATDLLRRISGHGSYAASNYYEPNFRRYFEGMSASISRLDGALRPEGRMLLVVQDSWFKGIHIDLAGCVEGIAANYGWELQGRRDFANVRSMVQINPRADKRAKASLPVESLLSFGRSDSPSVGA